MSIQFITSPSGERMVVLPESVYADLVAAAEDGDDRRAVETFYRRLAAGEEELVPALLIDRILAGESRVKVWREHRGLTAKTLADAAQIAPAFLSQIETGKRAGTTETLLKLATALNVSVDDLASHKVDPIHQRIEDILQREPGRTVAELAAALDVSEGAVRKDCRWLCGQGRIASDNGSPARFRTIDA